GVFTRSPPPSWLAMVLVPSVPAILPLMIVPASINKLVLLSIPPPNPADLFPDMVLEWIKVSAVVALTFCGAKATMPPPAPNEMPGAPRQVESHTCVALLFLTWLLVMVMWPSWEMAIPPPFPAEPTSTTELPWKMLLLIVAPPLAPAPTLGARKLKITSPPPPPWVVSQY